jgi:dihydroorotate dehydrogenase
VRSGADALEFASVGASAVQMYTAFGYDGPGAARRVKDELTELLKKEGKTWSQVVREAVEQTALKQPAVVGQLLGAVVVKEPKEPQTEIDKLISEAKELESKLDALAKVM